MDFRHVYSSHVDQIGYDEQSQELHVKYTNGKYAMYKDVPPEKADAVMGSASIGQALHQYIKGQHEHEYFDD